MPSWRFSLPSVVVYFGVVLWLHNLGSSEAHAECLTIPREFCPQLWLPATICRALHFYIKNGVEEGSQSRRHLLPLQKAEIITTLEFWDEAYHGGLKAHLVPHARERHSIAWDIATGDFCSLIYKRLDPEKERHNRSGLILPQFDQQDFFGRPNISLCAQISAALYSQVFAQDRRDTSHRL